MTLPCSQAAPHELTCGLYSSIYIPEEYAQIGCVHLWPGNKEEAGLVRNKSQGYQAFHLGMMGEDGRTEAAPDEPHRRGAGVLLSCMESLHGTRISAARNLCLSCGML